MALPPLVGDYLEHFDGRVHRRLVVEYNNYTVAPNNTAFNQTTVDYATLARLYGTAISEAQSSVRRPSELVHTNDVAPVLPVYAPVLHALEQQYEGALAAWASAHARTTVLAAMRACIKRHEYTGLDAMREALVAAVAPMPRDIEAWGRAAVKAQAKGDAYAIPIDATAVQAQLSVAMLRDFARRTGARPATAATTLADWMAEQIHAASDANVAWIMAREDWERVMARLADASVLETDAATRHTDELSRAINSVHRNWERLVATAPSMRQLQADAAAMLVPVLTQIDDVAAAYAGELPVFMPSDRVPGAPATRDSATLFTTTPAGSTVVALLQAARPLLPASAVTALRFVKTLPPSALANSAVLSMLMPRNPPRTAHLLDRLQAWASATGGVSDGGRAYDTLKARPP